MANRKKKAADSTPASRPAEPARRDDDENRGIPRVKTDTAGNPLFVGPGIPAYE